VINKTALDKFVFAKKSQLLLVLMVVALLPINTVRALELGELTVHSKLNQPLVAEVALLDVKGLHISELLVNIGEQYIEEKEQGARADNIHTSCHYIPDNTRLKVELNKEGAGVVHISTTTAIAENCIDVAIEAYWPDARMRRYYTVLVDEPINTPPVSVINTYRVRGNETLWEIARQYRPSSSVSIQQTVLAIKALTPSFFSHNININYFKSGDKLMLPTLLEITNTATKQEAYNEVFRQNALWRAAKKEQAQ